MRRNDKLSPPMNEAVVQLKILKYLSSLPGCWAIKVVSANQRGVPDIVGCCRGRSIALEVKSRGNKPSKIQQAQLKAIHAAGGMAAVVTSLKEVQALIEEQDDGPQK